MSSTSRSTPSASSPYTNSLLELLQTLVGLFPNVGHDCSEDDATFSYEATPSSAAQARAWLGTLAPHAALCDVGLACTVGDGFRGELGLRQDGMVEAVRPFTLNEDLYSAPDDPAALGAVDELARGLGRDGDTLALDDLARILDRFGKEDLVLALTVLVNKAPFGGSEDASPNGMVYVFPSKFLEQLKARSLRDLERDWCRAVDHPARIVLLRARGGLLGTYLSCTGPDALDQAGAPIAQRRDWDRLDKIRQLCDDQCRWEQRPRLLTPDHFFLENRGFGADCVSETAAEIEAEFHVIAAQLAVGYLADRTDQKPVPPTSRFTGARTCRVAAGRAAWRALIREQAQDPGPLLDLYRWAYENYSVDQLSIVRHLVAQELDPGPEGNEQRLVDAAGDILETARANLQQLVRRNIAEYFVARNQVCEFLRKYTDEIGTTISDLTGEMVSNLYKTLAAIIGAIVAAAITGRPDEVVLVTSGVYCVYVLFIILYLLPSIWKRFRLKQQEYANSVGQFVRNDVLLKEEVEGFQGDVYARAEASFRRYFFTTLALYGLLAVGAFAVAIAFALRVF